MTEIRSLLSINKTFFMSFREEMLSLWKTLLLRGANSHFTHFNHNLTSSFSIDFGPSQSSGTITDSKKAHSQYFSAWKSRFEHEQFMKRQYASGGIYYNPYQQRSPLQGPGLLSPLSYYTSESDMNHDLWLPPSRLPFEPGGEGRPWAPSLPPNHNRSFERDNRQPPSYPPVPPEFLSPFSQPRTDLWS
jgi:hypothetical protein